MTDDRIFVLREVYRKKFKIVPNWIWELHTCIVAEYALQEWLDIMRPIIGEITREEAAKSPFFWAYVSDILIKELEEIR